MLKSISFALLGFVFFLPWAAATNAPDAPAQRFTMQKIVFKGTRVFTDEQLLKALGMKVGGSYTQQDLVEAASKLGGSGVFSQVSYRLAPTWAEFVVVDNPRMLPVRFENCVWMTDEQALAALKERLPFFPGQVPEEGTLAEEIGKQLEAVLAEKGTKARVQYLPVIDKGFTTTTAINYVVQDPRVELSAVRFTGASPETTKAFDAAIKKILGKEYERTLLPRAEDDILKPILQQNGYLRSRFGESSLKLASAAADPVAKVELTVPVEEGAQYRIASLSMNGTDPIALDAAKRLAVFKTGDIANMARFRSEIATLGGAYLAAGYMNAKVRAVPTYDDTAHTVSFNIDLVPGEIYKLSKLDVQGLDEAQKAKLAALWKLNPGDVYDPTYAPSFLGKNLAKLAFLNGNSLAWTQKINDETRTVELYISFRRPGAGAR